MRGVQPSAEQTAPSEFDSAYAAGDFAELRRRSRRVMAQPGASADALEQARVWRARVGVERSAVVLLSFAALLFCAIVVHYVL
jgi:hypothetical protein